MFVRRYWSVPVTSPAFRSVRKPAHRPTWLSYPSAATTHLVFPPDPAPSCLAPPPAHLLRVDGASLTRPKGPGGAPPPPARRADLLALLDEQRADAGERG